MTDEHSTTSASKNVKPVDQTIDLLNKALSSGLRGNNKKAIQTALDALTKSDTGELTDLACRNLTYGDKPLRDKQHKGLRLEAKKKGMIWTYRYDFAGKQPVLQLGVYPDTGLSQAREYWLQARALINQGISPKDLRAEESIQKITVRQLCEKYLNLAEQNKESWKTDKQMIEANIIPLMGNVLASDVTSNDVAELIDAALERGSPRQAEKLVSLGRFMYNVALGRGKGRKWLVIKGSTKVTPWFNMPANPFSQIVTPEHEPESCVLKGKSLKAYLANFDTAGFSMAIRHILQLQLWCNTRIDEPANMAWDEVDLDDATWSIPSERTKNGLEHTVMLPTQAVELLDSIKPDELTGFVFAFDGRSRDYLNSAVAQEIRRQREHLKTPDNFTSHSLRHTGQTLLASMGCPVEIRDRIANHVLDKKSNMSARYNSHEYDKPAREWLQKMADKLDALKSPNVVQLETKDAN